MNLLCLAIDRLHVGYLGCYGSTWVATPALDRLAAEGFVFDQAVVDSLDLSRTYDGWWRGQLAAAKPPDHGWTFAELANSAHLRSLLITDDRAVLEHPAGMSFVDILELPPPPTESATADDVHSTHAAQSFAAISARLTELEDPFAAWIHLGTLGGAWDAPASFRERYRDEDDPPIPEFTALKSQTLPADADLDDRFALAMAYAAQVSLVDVCVGGLLEQLEERGLDERTAIVVCSPRGLALGEHREVGFHDRRLYAENVHVPLVVHLPGGRGRLRRSQALVLPGDLLPTFAELSANETDLQHPDRGRSLLPLIDGGPTTVRDRAVIVGDGESALRTAHWSLRLVDDAENEPGPSELFVKPDDFWEVNDVADRAAGAVDELRQCHTATRAAIAAGETPPPLPAAETMYDTV